MKERHFNNISAILYDFVDVLNTLAFVAIGAGSIPIWRRSDHTSFDNSYALILQELIVKEKFQRNFGLHKGSNDYWISYGIRIQEWEPTAKNVKETQIDMIIYNWYSCSF